MKKKVDIIISCYNEENNILPFYDEAIKYLNDDAFTYNIFFINDGSKDKTYEKICDVKNNHLTKNSNANIKVSDISFTKNFGHEAAMCAGLDNSNADYLIFMDSDLQHPPKKIIEILGEFKNGADCVLLRRTKYRNASIFKKFTSKAYYIFSRYVLRNKNVGDVSDFFAIDSSVAKKIKVNYQTRLRFMRSFAQVEAENIKIINYESENRYSGTSRYSYLKLTKLAIVSELSRSKFFRNRYKSTDDKPVYVIDKIRSDYE